ncbi:MAG: DNA repair protein RecN, partial [Clostridia bacterium]|nr:DNA repair protein RecN [Clostridia bacterium]
MLRRIHIRNVALIDEQSIEFEDGFSVLTGETGAGKSIIIESFNFVLGERANRDMIQYGEDRASVEAEFEISPAEPVNEVLKELEMEAEDGQLILFRELTASGKNTCRVNGIPVTASVLKQIGDTLIDIHGQHAHQSLLNVKMHLGLLDAFAKDRTASLLAETAACYRAYSEAKRALDEAGMNERERAQKCDLYAYQINEIEKADLKDGEEEELVRERNKLANAQSIMEALGGSAEGLGAEEGVLSKLSAVKQYMEGIAGISPEYAEMADRIAESYYALEDASYTVRGWSEGFSYDPSELDSIEWRLEQIARLKRKYGSSIKEILSYLEKTREEYDRLMTVEERREQLEKDCAKALSAYTEKAEKLSSVRKEAAEQLRKELVSEMADLGMPHAAFEARIGRLPGDAPSAKGFDSVEFMFSANRGEPVKPLAHIASGGEISRIMLAFKTATAGSDGIPTMVFDEIDTGVSGDISTALARKMREIAENRQVLCVTHLAQIAAYAHINYYVEKKTDGDRTVSVAVRLDESERAREIARIMSGSSDDPAALQHAENLIWSAKQAERK